MDEKNTSFHAHMGRFIPNAHSVHMKTDVLGRAYNEIIDAYKWETITILYEDSNSMNNMKNLFDKTSEVKRSKM